MIHSGMTDSVPTTEGLGEAQRGGFFSAQPSLPRFQADDLVGHSDAVLFRTLKLIATTDVNKELKTGTLGRGIDEPADRLLRHALGCYSQARSSKGDEFWKFFNW